MRIMKATVTIFGTIGGPKNARKQSIASDVATQRWRTKQDLDRQNTDGHWYGLDGNGASRYHASKSDGTFRSNVAYLRW